MTRNHRSTSSTACGHQRGVVLVVALVMLVVIGFASVAVMRNVMNNDLVSENNRRHTQAMQAAQAALRYCEGLLTTNTLKPTAAVATVNAERWHTFDNWKNEGSATTGGRLSVAASYLNSGTANRYADDDTKAPRPQCMAQERVVGTGRVVVITARGFSDNYSAKDGETQTGAVVWLQSIIQLV